MSYVDTSGMGVEIEITLLREYVVLVDGFLGEKQKEFDAEMDELATAGDEELLEWHSDDYWRLRTAYPMYLFNMVLVGTYSLVEDELKTLCGRIARGRGVVCQLKGYAPKVGFVERVKRYLEKECRVQVPGAEWLELDKVRKLRNAIVHNCRELKLPGDEELVDYLQNHGGRYDQNDGVLASRPFDEHVLALAYRCFTTLYFNAGYTRSPNGFTIDRPGPGL